jgi:AcrR family transcriptional regulator
MSQAADETVIIGHPSKPLIYSSPSIQQRRDRILKAARQLIAEHGVEGFGVRELCRSAKVAQRTLYNAFQNKDRIVALAIREAYEEVNRRTRYKTSADTLSGILDRLISVNKRNFRARNYTRAVAAIYFSPGSSDDVVRALQEMAFLNLRRWLKRVEEDGELAPWIVREELEVHLVNAEYATINDWARDRIPDRDYLRRLVESVLLITAGATIGRTHTEAVKWLKELKATGKVPQFPK